MAGPASTIGRYEILREIGRGAMGVVYEARDPALDRTVALKVIQPSAEGEEARVFEERFLAEARIAAALQHPGIVVVHDVGRDPASGTLFIALELVRGQTLAELAAAGPLDWRTALPLVAQVARALHHAHRHGVVHRDVKPANVVSAALRRSEGHGLRDRAAGERAAAPDHHGPVHRHAPLHRPGAGEDRGRGRPRRHLLAGLGRLHAPDGARRLHGAHDSRDRAPRRVRGAPPPLAPRPRGSRRRRAGARPRAGQGPGAPIPDGRGFRRGRRGHPRGPASPPRGRGRARGRGGVGLAARRAARGRDRARLPRPGASSRRSRRRFRPPPERPDPSCPRTCPAAAGAGRARPWPPPPRAWASWPCSSGPRGGPPLLRRLPDARRPRAPSAPPTPTASTAPFLGPLAALLPEAPGRLQISFDHPLRSGTLRVFVDDEMALEEPLTGQKRKKALVFGLHEGSSRTSSRFRPACTRCGSRSGGMATCGPSASLATSGPAPRGGSRPAWAAFAAT